MRREDWPDLVVFATVARERSFTKAAASLGVSTSAVSHALRGLEDRLGVGLVRRTTRSVAPTEAGERLLETLVPAMLDVEGALATLDAWRDRPAGRVRLTIHSQAMRWIVPRLPAFAAAYPDVLVDIDVDNARTDIVADGYDAGVRFGESLAKDVVSVRLGPDERAAIVATPAYFERFPPPRTPRDLTRHRCLGSRLVSGGPLYKWELEKKGRALDVAITPVFVTNDGDALVQAAAAGLGLAYTLETQVAEQLEMGTLVRVLEDWCPPFPGSFLYYPSRRQVTPALRALIEALRYSPTKRPSPRPR